MDCHILRLPTELRFEIYSYLFTGLKISLRRGKVAVRDHARTPWQILFTCRKFWIEDLPKFYDLVTVVLPHEMFIHVLKNRIGPQNMFLMRNLEIREAYMIYGGPDGAQLPPLLKKLVLWEKERVRYGTPTPLHDLDDETIRRVLRLYSKFKVDDKLVQVLQQNQQLAVFVCVELVRTLFQGSAVSEIKLSPIRDHSDNMLEQCRIHARAM